MTESTVEYDLGEVLGGNVDSVRAKLPDMSDAQLVAMLGLERAGSARKTLIDAIEGVQEGRKAAARANVEANANTAAPAPGGAAWAGSPDQVESVADEGDAEEIGPVLFTQAEVDVLLAERDILHEAEVKDLQEQLAKAAKSAAKPMTKRAAKARRMALDAKAEPGCSVVFTGEGDMVVTTLPQLDFDPAHFADDQGGRMLLQKIEFPGSSVRCEVHRAWLVDAQGRASHVARIGMMPLQFGGGIGAELAAPMLFRSE